MRKILTFILILCSVAAIAQMRGGALYDPGAIRSDGTNASDTVTLNRLKTATGIAATPAYSFSSDPNTGIYSPDADTIGFSAAGAEAMRVNSAGEVLIATSTDAGGYKLQVGGNFYQTGASMNFGLSETFISPRSDDGADNKCLRICGGGNSEHPTRGASLSLFGNEHAGAGGAALRVGGAGSFIIYTSESTLESMRVNSAGEVLIATSTDAGNYNLQVNGNAYFYNDVSALSFTDRTPAPENLAESYAIVESHEVKNKELNHSKLHPAAWGTKIRTNITGRMKKRVLDDGTEIEEPEIETISEPNPDGRNLSITITAQALVIKDLIKRIETLENKK